MSRGSTGRSAALINALEHLQQSRYISQWSVGYYGKGKTWNIYVGTRLHKYGTAEAEAFCAGALAVLEVRGMRVEPTHVEPKEFIEKVKEGRTDARHA